MCLLKQDYHHRKAGKRRAPARALSPAIRSRSLADELGRCVGGCGLRHGDGCVTVARREKGETMRTLIIGVSLVLALSQAAPAEGEDLNSANAIMPGCRFFLEEPRQEPRPNITPFQEGFKEGECLGFILGVDAGARLAATPKPWCIPEAASNGQIVRVVVNYIDRHPEEMHRHFAVLAFDALLQAWPCKP